MQKNIVALARELMRKQTAKNKAPAWLLTELAVTKGKELAKRHHVDEQLVVASLYLAHTIFDPIWKGKIQQHHPELSAKFVKRHLKKWGVRQSQQDIILNAIKAHHDDIPTTSKIAEVVKNAECAKFVTVEGSLIWLHELGLRGVPLEEAINKVLQKMEQKKHLLTLKDCKQEAQQQCKKIVKLFAALTVSHASDNQLEHN